MAFRMNKPIIKGTTKHSALLAKAEEATRTHGVDPILGGAATTYGQSFTNLDVIDYNIKSRKLDWGKKKKKKKKKNTSTTEVTTPTVNDNKKIIAKKDEKAALDRLRETVNKKLEGSLYPDPEFGTDATIDNYDNYDNLDYDAFNPPEKEDVDDIPKKRKLTGSVADWDNAKFDKDGNLISGEGVKVQSVEGVSTVNLKTSYTAEERKRLIFSEEHGREVLPEEIGIKPDVIIDKSTIEKKDKRKLDKAEEGKSQKRNMGKQSDVVGTIDGVKVTNSDIGELRRIARSSQNFREKMEAKKKLDRLQKN